jgi:hypothetical protein
VNESGATLPHPAPPMSRATAIGKVLLVRGIDMRMKKPRRASIDEVRITRKDHAATIEHADRTISTIHLTIGSQINSMSDSDILELLNATIEAQDLLAAEHDRTLIEIPPGRPQIRFHEGSEQWVPRGDVPRGDVLRCQLEDDEAGELVDSSSIISRTP